MKTRFLKIVSVILTVLMISGMVPAAFAADGAPAGTESDPIVISDAAGLAALADDPAAYDGKYITLSADINLADLASYTPIGTEAVPFKGIFDGCGYTVSGASTGTYLTKSNSAVCCGLFGYAVGAEIRNVKLMNLHIQCKANAGIALGYGVETTVSNVEICDSACSVQTYNNAGGIVGYLESGTVQDCKNNSASSPAAVKTLRGNNAGGIVGCAVSSQILRCINGAKVQTKYQNCAGIVGSLSGTVSHCINKADITSTYQASSANDYAQCAGIVGFADGETDVSCCGNGGSVTASQNTCSGVVGYGPAASVSFCYNAGTLTRGMSLVNRIGSETDCISSDDSPADDMTDVAVYAGWDFDNMWLAPSDDIHGYPYPTLKDCNFHTIELTADRPATCTKAEMKTYACMCGYEYSEEGEPALGHQMTTITVSKATCVDDGETVQICNRPGCGYTDESTRTVVPATGEHVDADNNNECDVCGATIKEPEQEPEKKSFFQKIIDFFKRIFDWIRNLFTRNKD